MERQSSKRRKVVIPVQKGNDKVGKWDEFGGVFTQENPRASSVKKQSSSQCKFVYDNKCSFDVVYV
jgi:hypothetical protein